MYKLHKDVLGLRTSDGSGWEDLCIKLPIVKVGGFEEEDKTGKKDGNGIRSRRSAEVSDGDDFFSDGGFFDSEEDE